MKKLKKAMLIVMLVAVALVLVGCGTEIVPDGSTGVVVTDGIVSENYLPAGRHTLNNETRTSVVIIDNKVDRFGKLIKIFKT